jgi:glycosyltransferase involved in cell wall biosynthesis
MLKPQDDNPKGFWENQIIKELNDEILKRLGGSWHDPPNFPAAWESLSEFADIRRRARNLIQQDFLAINLWGWKDPRACLTLPFWQKLLPPMRYVICLRNPVDVARSLEGRENLPLERSIKLWLTYVKSSLDHTAGQPRIIVFFEDAMAQPGPELERLRDFLGHPEKTNGSRTLRAVEEFIDEELQHHRTPLIDLVDNPAVSFSAKALYMAMRFYVKPAWKHTGIDGTQKLSEVIDSFGRYAFGAYLEQGRLQQQLGELEVESIEQQQRLAQISLAREQLAEQASQLKDELSASRNQGERLAQDLLLVRNALADEKDKLGQANDSITGLKEELGRAKDRIVELESELTQANGTIAGLVAELAEANERIGDIKTAFSEERSRAERILSDADRALSDRESALLELRRQSEAELLERDRKIESLELMQSGLFWELLSAYRRTKDRSFPPGTKRRALYDKGLQHVKGLRNRTGLSQLVFLMAKHPVRSLRNANRVNINKFFYHIQHSDSAIVEEKLERKLGLDQPSLPSVGSKVQKFGLIISGCPGDAFRYRCEHQAEQLRLLGLTVDVAYFDQVDYPAALEGYQCYWLHRVAHTDLLEDFIRRAQKRGKPVIFDTDDLVFDEEKIPYIRALQWMPSDEVDLYYDGVRRYHRTLSLCRFATVTTEPLREAIQKLFPQNQCYINPNVLSDAQLKQAEAALQTDRPAEDNQIVRIAYFSGTRTHNIDFEECSRALERVLETHSNVRLMLVGHLDVGTEFDRFGDRIERYPLLPWHELPKMLRNVDINLAPLELDNPFTESKSTLKYFEAAVMGVPTVASDVRAYQACIRHGENGFLCRTEEDWVDYLARLVQGSGFRSEMGNRSKIEVLEQVTTRKQAERLKSIITEILQTSPQSLNSRFSVAFILRAPIAQVGGGYKNIFRLANYLADQGHEVNVYVEPIAHLEGKSDSEIVEFCHTHFGKSAAEIRIGHDGIKRCDIAIATNWPTAYVVASLTNTLCKAYLIQDFEPDFYEYESPSYKEATTTYALPLRKITLGRHLANMFEREDQLPVASIDFGIDHGIFNNHNRKESEDKVRILFFARPALKRRGFDMGIEALEQVYRNCSTLEICCYGMEEKKALPFPYTNLGILSPAELAKAMRNADIHLSFSFTNISFVPFEAMACGCAVVEAKVPPVQAMVEDGKHCLLAQPEPDAVATALRRLIEDGNLRSRIAKTGMKFVSEKTWDKSCKQFEDILFDCLLKKQLRGGDALAGTAELLSGSSRGTDELVAQLSPRDSSVRGVFYRSCNFCGGEKFRVFKRLETHFPERIYGDHDLTYPDVGKHLKLQYLECINCGLIGINPLTRFSDINRHCFDGERNIVAWADLDYVEYAAGKLKDIKFVYEDYQFYKYRLLNRLLDVSCGPGVSLKWFRDNKLWDVYGVDPDRHSARIAQDRYNVEIKNGLIYDLPVPDEYFDLIIMDNSLEHTFDPLSTLLKAFQLLRKGGALFVFTPNSAGLSTRALNANIHWGHWFLYSPKVLYEILRRIGYSVPKLSAIQDPINPELLKQGVDVERFRKELAVSLVGEKKIAEAVCVTSFYADFFNLIAVKPEENQISADRESALDMIAQYSTRELAKVEVISDSIETSSDHRKKPLIFKDHDLAHKLLDNLRGLEIGAATHNPFRLRTRNVAHPESYHVYVELGLDPGPVDIWASAENIPVPDGSEDFIISSHVVEHLPNLILTFIEWNRIVRDGGYVFLIVPQKAASAEDAKRGLTSLAHFVNDYHRGVTLDTHTIDGVPWGRMGHYHTFTPDSLLEVVKWMGVNRLCHWDLVAREDVDSKVGNGFTLVFQIRHTRVCTNES